MRRNPFKKGLITSVFITMLLTGIFIPSFLPEATAIAKGIKVSITPEKGRVGDTVHINGTIETQNGTYVILFDEEMVKNGTAVDTAIDDIFIVPPRPMGSYSVTLLDLSAQDNYTSPRPFTVETAYFIRAVVPSSPEQLQEGESTKILVNVTGGVKNTCHLANVTVTAPSGRVYYNDTLRLTNTTDTGYGEGPITYPANFNSGAHTNYTGTYFIAFNETATANFTVGLTDKLEYRRTDCVNIQGAGYKANETVTINITYYNDTFPLPVEGYPKTENASDGTVTYAWQIPDNTTLGTYNVTLTGTIIDKPVKDTQNFTVIFIKKPLLNQSRGRWKTPIRVIGEIETFGENYTILWDGESIKEGKCAPNSGVVNDTFTVPVSIKGSHNVTLYDVNKTDESLPSVFEVTTACYLSAEPARIQEGLNATITVGVHKAEENATYTFIVNITDPLDEHSTAAYKVVTDETGSGSNSTKYWGEFEGANTDYLGNYSVTVNGTLATGSFTVGLTDELEYRGEKRVRIRGSGYNNQTVTINIKGPEVSISGYPKNVNASEGVVEDTWLIPENATLGIYTVTLNNTKKPRPDIQNFTIIKIIVHCKTQNRYDDEPLANVYIEASVAGIIAVADGETNETGWVDFRLDRGNYTFTAKWNEEDVGSLNGTVAGKATKYVLQLRFYIKCELARITMRVTDEAVPPRRPRALPFINVTLISNETSLSFETDYIGIIATNAFTKVSYRIEARRYGHLFFNQSIGNLTETFWNLTKPFPIICPTYTLFIHASDSKERPIQNRTVEAIEWSSGRIAGEGKTNQWGSVRLNCTFGRYKIRVYNLEHTVVLNETVVDVIRNQFYLVLRCRIVNLDLSVKVIDYLGHPIPNAKVILNLTTSGGMEIVNLTTGPDGIASKHKILGGDYRIAIYVAGRLCRAKSLYLDESREIVFQVGDYVMVGGFPLKSNQFITGISLTMLVVFCALTLIYRRHSKNS